jgi:hypothetical protein
MKDILWNAFADELEKQAGAGDIAKLLYLRAVNAASRGAGAAERGLARMGGSAPAVERGGGFFRPGNLDEMSRGIQATSVNAPIVMLPGTGMGTAIKATVNPYTRGGRRNLGRFGLNIGARTALLGLGAAGGAALGNADLEASGLSMRPRTPFELADPVPPAASPLYGESAYPDSI